MKLEIKLEMSKDIKLEEENFILTLIDEFHYSLLTELG